MLNFKVRSKYKSPNQGFPKCSQSFRAACQSSSFHPPLFHPSWEVSRSKMSGSCLLQGLLAMLFQTRATLGAVGGSPQSIIVQETNSEKRNKWFIEKACGNGTSTAFLLIRDLAPTGAAERSLVKQAYLHWAQSKAVTGSMLPDERENLLH